IDDWRERLAEYDVFFYTQQNPANSLAATELPADIQKLFILLEEQQSIEASSFTRLKLGRREKTLNGRERAYVLDMPSNMLYSLRRFSERIAVQVLLALAISAAACFVLARYLTRNLEQISQASKALAGGDLSARAHVTNRAMKDEISLLAEEFNHMAESVEQGIENQKRLVRDISHELRSPLARLQIALELARQNNKTKAPEVINRDQPLDRIAIEAERLNDMIGQLLAMPERTGHLEDTIDLGEMLRAIADDNRIEADKKNARLQLHINETDPLVKANANQLHSALENILRNAIHYTDTATSVDISLSRQDKNTYLVEVRDKGPGIPEEDLARVFEPFYRVDKARNRKTGGYGIGLAIVHRVVQNHGGTVSARNLAQGLLISIELPAAHNTGNAS
ncbi:MAG: HAMP domain-containing protein, partial [Pseudomonadales bacterium]|nr:HAMP domain-containing protein [Pseudomonadales bacterium]